MLLLKAVADCDEFASEHEDHVYFDSVAWCMMICSGSAAEVEDKGLLVV